MLDVSGEATVPMAKNTYLNDSTTTSTPETTSPELVKIQATSTANIIAETHKKIPLYIGGIFSLGGLWEASGILPAVQMGLDHINDRMDVLPEYELRMVWNDSQVCGLCF